MSDTQEVRSKITLLLTRTPALAALAAAFLLLLFSRRPAQLLSPQVWNEDGLYIVPALLTRGWLSIADPLYDYVLLVPRLVTGLSLWISFYHYPLVSTLLTWIFIAAVGIAIARSPTTLRAPALCALAVFVVPTDPEVFGLPIYTLWWATLLLLLAAVWNEEGKGWGWRLGFIAVAGLSSPVVVLLPPVLLARAFFARARRHELLAAALAIAIACVQIAFALKQGVVRTPGTLASTLQNALPVLVGKFVAGNWGASMPLLWISTSLLAAIAVLHLRQGADRRTFWTLAYLLAGTVVLAAIRVDPAILDPRTGAPRYFFLPFVLISWMLLQCAVTAPRTPHAILAGLVLLAAAANAVPVWTRSHVDLHWAESVRSCARFASYPIPIQVDGSSTLVWSLWLSGSTCAHFMTQGLWPAPADVASLPTVPYAKWELGEGPPGTEPGALVSATMQGTDLERSSLPGFRVIGSFGVSGADTGEVLVRMTRGGRLRYRSGPSDSGQVLTILGHESAFTSRLPTAPKWVFLEFSNSALPEQFVVRIEDRGLLPGEWSAVAIKEP